MNSSRKGANGERELAAILEAEGYHMERGGTESYGTAPDLSGLPGIHVEVKRVERLNVFEAMAQAIRDSKRFRDGMPTVFHRRNRTPWLVTMLLTDWLRMYKAALNSKAKPQTSAGLSNFPNIGELEKGEKQR